MSHALGQGERSEMSISIMSPPLNQDERSEMGISTGKANFWFIVICLTMALDYMDRFAVNAVLPMLKLEFQFTDTQLGLIGSIVGISISLLVLPAAIIADKWSHRKLIAIMVAIWSIATLTTSMAKGYITLLLARLGVGSGEAGYNATSIALISAWFPKKKRGTMVGFFFSAGRVGELSGILLAGIIAHHYGWRMCFGILAVPGLILALLCWFLPDYKAVKVEQNKEKKAKGGVRESIIYIMKTPTLIYTYLLSSAIVLSLMTFATWGVTFYSRTFKMNVKQASYLIALSAIFGVLGGPFAGWVADKIAKKTNKARLLVAALNGLLFLVLITASLQIALATANLFWVFTFWSLAAFFLSGISPLYYTTTQELVAPYFRAMSASFIPLVQQVLGGVPGPVIAGAISDRMGLPMALQIVYVISIGFALLFIFLAIRSYDKDVVRVNKLGTFKMERD